MLFVSTFLPNAQILQMRKVRNKAWCGFILRHGFNARQHYKGNLISQNALVSTHSWLGVYQNVMTLLNGIVNVSSSFKMWAIKFVAINDRFIILKMYLRYVILETMQVRYHANTNITYQIKYNKEIKDCGCKY